MWLEQGVHGSIFSQSVKGMFGAKGEYVERPVEG